MITLHLWDTGSVGIPIDKQIMTEFLDSCSCLDTLLTSTNHRIYIAFDDRNSFRQSSQEERKIHCILSLCLLKSFQL